MIPRLSIITVTFNSEKTIERTLKSVAAQTYKNIEHIVIDGASTDGTLNIIEKYKDGLSYFRSESDRGVYDAMNKGIAVARGDVIAFLNSDDFYEDHHTLNRIASEMKDEQIDAVFGNVVFFEAGQPARIVRKFNSNRFRADMLAWGWMPAHPGLFVRKRVFDRVGVFRPEYRLAGDFEFMVRIFKDKEINYKALDAVLVRMQLGGLSTQGLRSAWIAQQELISACRQNGISSNHLKLFSRYVFKIFEYKGFPW